MTITQALFLLSFVALACTFAAFLLLLVVRDKAAERIAEVTARTAAVLALATLAAFLMGACAAPVKDEGQPDPGPVLEVDAGSPPILGQEDAGPEEPPPVCGAVEASTSPVTPTVWLVVDGSSSMSEPFSNGVSRWTALRDTLVGQGGVVDQLQASVLFGMVIYSGAGAECLDVRVAPPALGNLRVLQDFYPRDPTGGGTPTDRALAKALELAGDDIVILATDGQPNSGCSGSNSNDPTYPVKVVELARGRNLQVISLAGSDTSLQAHLDNVASVTRDKIGAYAPKTSAALVETFKNIASVGSCILTLDGRVTAGQECSGEVTLNGRALECSKDYSFRAADTLEIIGAACDEYAHSKSDVHASFPCGIVIPG